VVCALFIPEAWFANVQTMEPIVLKNLPPERFNKVDNLLVLNTTHLAENQLNTNFIVF
jgi:hypothetical protein